MASAMVGVALAVASGPALAIDWIMASGYSEENFHIGNIREFIEEVEETIASRSTSTSTIR